MKRTIKDFSLKGKKVLIRCDFNVPMKDGKITDDARIIESLPTIRYAVEKGAKVVLFSHLGRIKEASDLEKNSLKPVAMRLEELLEKKVNFSEQTRGKELEEKIESLKEGQILLVQNTRYEDLDGKKESSNDEELGKYWASLGDIFINDAFGTAHRAHASNVGIATHLESGIGFLIEKELKALEQLEEPEHPFIVILGGAKVKDKIGVIENLVTQADYILIGGGMAYTFLNAEGYAIGNSLFDQENLEFCKQILENYSDKIILPIDTMVSTEFSESGRNRMIDINQIEYNEMGMDIGSETITLFERYLKDAKTIVWNGPLGVCEFSKYATGTKKILEYISQLSTTVILGGGDTGAIANKMGYKEKLTHISTGGGATLEYLEGKQLPGLAVIKERREEK